MPDLWKKKSQLVDLSHQTPLAACHLGADVGSRYVPRSGNGHQLTSKRKNSSGQNLKKGSFFMNFPTVFNRNKSHLGENKF